MQHIQYIEESTTWVCPKSGKWKVICIGGGSSGGFRIAYVNNRNDAIIQNTGGISSFGDILSADGGSIEYTILNYTYNSNNNSYLIPDEENVRSVGGEGGYNGICFGGSPARLSKNGDYSAFERNGGFLGLHGNGYGAGGGAIGTPTYSFLRSDSDYQCFSLPKAGKAGTMRAVIADITAGDEFICTVGKGGSDNLTERFTNLKNGKYTVYYNYNSGYFQVTAGNDGAIILEYLGA